MIIVVLPVYNEEKNIQKLLNDISLCAKESNWNYRICIADDGSSDSTVQIVESLKEKMPVDVVLNPINMGPGAAFDLGFRKVLASASDDDIIVTMEADNTSDLSILDKMVSIVREGADLVLASCYAADGQVNNISLLRRILSRGANFLVKFIFREKAVNTFSSFYRCYRARILKEAYRKYGDKFIEEDGFTCAVDIFLKLVRLDVRIVEVPSVLKCNLRVGRSKMKMIKTTIAYLKLFSRELFARNANIN